MMSTRSSPLSGKKCQIPCHHDPDRSSFNFLHSGQVIQEDMSHGIYYRGDSPRYRVLLCVLRILQSDPQGGNAQPVLYRRSFHCIDTSCCEGTEESCCGKPVSGRSLAPFSRLLYGQQSFKRHRYCGTVAIVQGFFFSLQPFRSC